MTLTEAVESNDRRQTLLALRSRIAEVIDATESGRDIAALSKRLIEVERELDSIPDPHSDESPIEVARRKCR